MAADAPAPTDATYRIEVRSLETGLPNPDCRFTEGAIEAEYGRVLDDVSEASITVLAPDDNEGCVDCQPREWLDELVFYRGRNPEPVWQGPIVAVADSGRELTINALDRMANMGDRRAGVDHPALEADQPSVDPGVLLRWILERAERFGPLGLRVMTPLVAAPADLVTAKIEATDLLYDALDDLAGDQLDWTVVGPRLYYGAPTIVLAALPQLDTRLHWLEGGASLERQGQSIATEVEVLGAGGVRAVYAGPAWAQQTAFYRPLRIVRERLTSQRQAEALARQLWADSRRAQEIVVTSSSLSPDAPLAVEDLIPGRALQVHHNRGARSVTALQRLTAVTVAIVAAAEAGGWALNEAAVEVEMEPAVRRVESDED